MGCFCRDDIPNGDPQPRKCSTECNGEESDYACGGLGYLTFYEVSDPITECDLQPVVDGTSKLKGCFPFDDNEHYLTKEPFTDWWLMTNEVGIGWHLKCNQWNMSHRSRCRLSAIDPVGIVARA